MVQESASGWVRVSTVAMVLPSLAVDCYLGAWSDRVGRKATLVLPPIGAAAASIVYCLMGEQNVFRKYIRDKFKTKISLILQLHVRA